MTITATQVQALIIARVGDIDPATMHPPVFTPPAASPGIIATNMAVLWERYAAADVIAPGLRELIVERDAIKMVIATLRDRAVDIGQPGTGLVVKEFERIETLQQQLKDVNTQITGLLAASGARAKGAADLILAQQPITSVDMANAVPLPLPDANDIRYGGNPYTDSQGTRWNAP